MDRTSTARVTLLDGFSLELGAGASAAAVDILPRGAQRLVAHLGLAGRPARGAVAGSLWPDVPEEHAHGSLRSTLWRLQKAAPGLVVVSGGSLGLSPKVRVDVRELTAWARQTLDNAGAGDLAAPAVALHGELLPGWYDDWVLLERERLRQLRMHALEVLAARLLDAGRHGAAIQIAYAALGSDPLRESSHRIIIRAHLAEGNVAEAVRVYQCFCRVLADELGVSPTRQMLELVRSERWRTVGS